MALQTPVCDFGWRAVHFSLADPNGRRVALADITGTHGTLVMFICNHCPYVRAVAHRLARDVRELQERGIGAVAVMPNDWRRYPDDAPQRMPEFAQRHGFTFPYVIDETQNVARIYGAICTPDFFGFNRDLELQYRGRLDSAGMQPPGPDTRRELLQAMIQVAETGRGPQQQFPSMGCSIKWRDES